MVPCCVLGIAPALIPPLNLWSALLCAVVTFCFPDEPESLCIPKWASAQPGRWAWLPISLASQLKPVAQGTIKSVAMGLMVNKEVV